jgi:hypothetical protein
VKFHVLLDVRTAGFLTALRFYAAHASAGNVPVNKAGAVRPFRAHRLPRQWRSTGYDEQQHPHTSRSRRTHSLGPRQPDLTRYLGPLKVLLSAGASSIDLWRRKPEVQPV